MYEPYIQCRYLVISFLYITIDWLCNAYAPTYKAWCSGMLRVTVRFCDSRLTTGSSAMCIFRLPYLVVNQQSEIGYLRRKQGNSRSQHNIRNVSRAIPYCALRQFR